MKSSARLHFPPIRWHGQEKRLWNRVWRRSCKDLPEERVRLRFLDWLLLQHEWPPGHIASERSLSSGHAQRTDLLCHDEEGNPSWLIECKAPSVRIGESASLQIAQYNRIVQAPVLCLTNGVSDYWYRTDGDRLDALDAPPIAETLPIEAIRQSTSYWVDRGFLGHKSSEALQEALTGLCRQLYDPSHADSIFYLEGTWRNDHLYLTHDYRSVPLSRRRLLAVAPLSDASGSSWISALHHENGATNAMIQIPLDPETGVPSDTVHYHLTDRKGSVPRSSILPDPLPLQADQLIPALDQLIQSLLTS
ncbi:MAG: type I restriction enzyme HsdR N-terminal domain-containing protein [Balneolaceae bacterium]